jgi:NAD(P)-dependent dehydrogenase (short-subunit alcohol dehydrogenase family)
MPQIHHDTNATPKLGGLTNGDFPVPSAMAKAAVHAMTMSLAVESARYGIRLNALAPA